MERLTIAILVTIFVTGCVTRHAFIKAYPGKEVSASELALLKPVSGIVIVSIDVIFAQNIGVTETFGNADLEIGLLSGQHVVAVGYYDGRKIGVRELFS